MHQVDFNLSEAIRDYIAERLIDEQGADGVEVCERYLNGQATDKEITALYKWFCIPNTN